MRKSFVVQPPKILSLTVSAMEPLRLFIQSVANDLSNAIEGGLSIKDSNLPFEYREVTVTNGKPFRLKGSFKTKTVGAFPVLLGDSELTTYASKLNDKGEIEITMTLSRDSAKVTFLICGE